MTAIGGCRGGVIRQWEKQRKRDYLKEGEDAVISRAMRWRRKAVMNYCRLRGRKGIGRWWEGKIGRTEEDVCPKYRKSRRRTTEGSKSEGRKGTERLGKGKWDSWDALASKWMRMEELTMKAGRS